MIAPPNRLLPLPEQSRTSVRLIPSGIAIPDGILFARELNLFSWSALYFFALNLALQGRTRILERLVNAKRTPIF